MGHEPEEPDYTFYVRRTDYGYESTQDLDGPWTWVHGYVVDALVGLSPSETWPIGGVVAIDVDLGIGTSWRPTNWALQMEPMA